MMDNTILYERRIEQVKHIIMYIESKNNDLMRSTNNSELQEILKV